MYRSVSVLVLSTLVLTSCGTVRDSRLNPLNWFGSSRVEAKGAGGNINPLIPTKRESIFQSKGEAAYGGRDVLEVTELSVERRPGGALIRAAGLTRQQGGYAVKLIVVPEESDAKTLTYALRAIQPIDTPVGSKATREVTAAIDLTEEDLLGVRVIRVKSHSNVRSVRR